MACQLLEDGKRFHPGRSLQAKTASSLEPKEEATGAREGESPAKSAVFGGVSGHEGENLGYRGTLQAVNVQWEASQNISEDDEAGKKPF